MQFCIKNRQDSNWQDGSKQDFSAQLSQLKLIGILVNGQEKVAFSLQAILIPLSS